MSRNKYVNTYWCDGCTTDIRLYNKETDKFFFLLLLLSGTDLTKRIDGK